MAASQVVTSPKKTGKGDNLWWPESKDEEYKSCGRCNRYLSGQGGGLRAECSLRGAEKGAGPVVRSEHGGGLPPGMNTTPVFNSGGHTLIGVK